MNIIKVCTLLLIFVGISGAHADETKDETVENSMAEIINSSTTNISRHAQKSRQAAVRVVSADGHGSGTYVKVGRHYGIMTAAHVISDNNVLLIDFGNKQTVGIPMWQNQANDLAFIWLPEKIEEKRPLQISEHRKIKAGEEIVYSGYPGQHEMLTFRCSVANAESDDSVTIQGFAWFGASGSGFINKKGDVFAVLSAVPVENFYGHPQVISTIVIASMIKQSDIDEITKMLELLPQQR